MRWLRNTEKEARIERARREMLAAERRVVKTLNRTAAQRGSGAMNARKTKVVYELEVRDEIGSLVLIMGGYGSDLTAAKEAREKERRGRARFKQSVTLVETVTTTTRSVLS